MTGFKLKVTPAAVIGMMMWFMGCHSTTVTEFAPPVTDETGCAAALPVTFQDGVFVHSGELSDLSGAAYFALHSPQPGDWLLLETRNDELREPSFDPVISIYAMNGSERYAAVDDGFTGLSVDSHFYYHIKSVESLCIKVESYDRWTDSLSPGEGMGQSLGYTLRLALNEQNRSTYEVAQSDAENDSLSGSVPFQLHEHETIPGLSLGWIHGELSDLTDGDRYGFIAPALESVVELYVNTDGGVGNPETAESGTGSTATIAVQILDANESLVAELIPGDDSASLSFLPLPNTAYYIRVSGAPEWQPGMNDFYSMQTVIESLEGFPVEPEGPNDSMATATEVSLTNDGYNSLEGATLGQLASVDLVDYYRIGLVMGQELTLYCAGASLGSGLEDFTVSAFDEAGTLVAEQTEDESPIDWSMRETATVGALVASRDENVYLRISAVLPPQPTSRFYYCYFSVTPAE